MPTSIKISSLFFTLGFAVIAIFYNTQYSKLDSNCIVVLTEKDSVDSFTQITNTVINDFLILVETVDEPNFNHAISRIRSNWKESHEIMLLESIYFIQNVRRSEQSIRLLKEKTGKDYGFDFDKWFQYIWNKKSLYDESYFEFKAKLHERIDPKFGRYFSERGQQSTIRLDEVRWGGVLQDGIPPLRNPKMISIDEAKYLKDSNVVFGIEINGDARAYPKRILAWHEMFVDSVGRTPVAGVYCTLCGTVILYKTEHGNLNYEIGTSGFLYRSNKLMYDKKTQSLWSTLEGEPVIGPLVGKGIKLDYLSVVTTTWGEWKKRHPDTSVLSLQTGYQRNYDEGSAYEAYFATDDLMFSIPEIDKSLKNKDEILSIRMPNDTDENIAISSKFLKKNPIYSSKISNTDFTVFTDKTGAHRVYKSKLVKFLDYDKMSTVTDEDGVLWTLSEEKMKNEKGEVLDRLPTHNAFWFGYKAAFPSTQLIK